MLGVGGGSREGSGEGSVEGGLDKGKLCVREESFRLHLECRGQNLGPAATILKFSLAKSSPRKIFHMAFPL